MRLSLTDGMCNGCSAHDERDFEFATKFNLPIRKVILQDGTNESDELEICIHEVGTMINSGHFNGLRSDEGITKVIKFLRKNNFGKRKNKFRLRDWLISRQRYWEHQFRLFIAQGVVKFQ